MKATMIAVPISAFLAGVIFGIFLHFSDPSKETIDIWLPEDHNIVNKVGDTYFPLDSYQPGGTLINVSFGEYQRLFSDNRSTVAITKGGLVYYSTENEGQTFMSFKQYRTEDFFRDVKVTAIRADGEIDIYRSRYFPTYFVPSFLSCIVILCLLSIGASIDSDRERKRKRAIFR